MKIRILLLITDLELGGTPLSVKRLACGLDKNRFDVCVACLAPAGEVALQLQQCHIPVYCLGAKGCWDLRVFYRLLRLLIKLRPDILHCFLVHANIAGRLTGRLLALPCIIGSIRTAEKTKRWHLIAENLTFRMGDITLCNSLSVYRHTKRYSHVPDKYLHTITNGVDIDYYANAKPLTVDNSTAHVLIPASIGLRQGKTNLIFVGRLDPVKNLDTLLYALHKLLQYNKTHSQHNNINNLQLIIVGDGPQKQHLVELVQKLHLTDNVLFTGFRNSDEVAGLLRVADIFIMPSYQEGCSGATLEAMASALAVVAARSAGLYDLIKHRHTGLLFDANDTNGLVYQVQLLIEQPQLARQLGQNAQQLARKRFSLDTMIRQYSQLYHNLRCCP